MARAPLEILIVEDNPNKKKKLFERLRGLPEIFCEPDVVVCTSEAVRRLIDKSYDLLILDIVVPVRPDGEPNEQNSMDLLARIDAGAGGVRRPRHVLSISSADSISAAVGSFFRGRPWGCIQYKEDSSQSLDDIEQVGRWIFSEPNLARVSKCDAFIVTALEEPEFTALESEIKNLGPLLPLDSTQLVRYCEIATKTQTLKVGIAFAPRMGPVASAILCTKVIEQLRPRILLMSGICGAIGAKADIGDLIVAEASWDWQSGKFVDNGGNDFEIAPHQINIPTGLRNVLIRIKRDTTFWEQFARDAIALKVDLPKLVTGPVATGAAVVADERITKKIKEEQHKNVVAVDMETYAVYAAAASADYTVGALSLKAVSDRADRGKNDLYRVHASTVSARCTLHLLSQYGDEVLELFS